MLKTPGEEVGERKDISDLVEEIHVEFVVKHPTQLNDLMNKYNENSTTLLHIIIDY